jgi:hypothetical protein
MDELIGELNTSAAAGALFEGEDFAQVRTEERGGEKGLRRRRAGWAGEGRRHGEGRQLAQVSGILD